jgi:hypothetical protein
LQAAGVRAALPDVGTQVHDLRRRCLGNLAAEVHGDCVVVVQAEDEIVACG